MCAQRLAMIFLTLTVVTSTPTNALDFSSAYEAVRYAQGTICAVQRGDVAGAYRWMRMAQLTANKQPTVDAHERWLMQYEARILRDNTGYDCSEVALRPS